MRQFKLFVTNMIFMIHHSWDLARSKYFVMIIQAVINTAQPFALLIMPKYILDELAGQRRPDVTMKYIALYAGVIVFFNIVTLLLNRYGSLRTIKNTHQIEMYNQKKWLYMDYGNLENGQVQDLAGRCVGQVDPQNFAEGTVLGFFTNLFQLAGYTYIIASLHPLVIVFILAVIGTNTLITRKLNKIGYEYEPIIAKFSRRYSYIYRTMVSFKI